MHAELSQMHAWLAHSCIESVCRLRITRKKSRLSYESANERVIDFCFFIKSLSVGSSEHTIRIW